MAKRKADDDRYTYDVLVSIIQETVNDSVWEYEHELYEENAHLVDDFFCTFFDNCYYSIGNADDVCTNTYYEVISNVDGVLRFIDRFFKPIQHFHEWSHHRDPFWVAFEPRKNELLTSSEFKFNYWTPQALLGIKLRFQVISVYVRRFDVDAEADKRRRST